MPDLLQIMIGRCDSLALTFKWPYSGLPICGISSFDIIIWYHLYIPNPLVYGLRSKLCCFQVRLQDCTTGSFRTFPLQWQRFQVNSATANVSSSVEIKAVCSRASRGCQLVPVTSPSWVNSMVDPQWRRELCCHFGGIRGSGTPGFFFHHWGIREGFFYGTQTQVFLKDCLHRLQKPGRCFRNKPKLHAKISFFTVVGSCKSMALLFS